MKAHSMSHTKLHLEDCKHDAACKHCQQQPSCSPIPAVLSSSRLTNMHAGCLAECWCGSDILPGQGLYYATIDKSWRAKNCDSNNYGTANKTYGLTPRPCVACPSDMVANRSTAYPASASFFTSTGTAAGFTNERACVTRPGVYQPPSRCTDSVEHYCCLQLLLLQRDSKD